MTDSHVTAEGRVSLPTWMRLEASSRMSSSASGSRALPAALYRSQVAAHGRVAEPAVHEPSQLLAAVAPEARCPLETRGTKAFQRESLTRARQRSSQAHQRVRAHIRERQGSHSHESLKFACRLVP